MQPTPALAVSEYNAKQAIHMQILLNSLAKSEYALESWTLTDCSAELINTQPKNCFKKQGYTVEVWFDHKKEKAFPYPNWRDIYYQDDTEKWHKVEGKFDVNGLYYTEKNGDRVYFAVFGPDAEKFGETGEWTVKYRNTTLVSTSSSARRAATSSKASATNTRDTETPTTSTRGATTSWEADSSSAATTVRDRGRRQGGSSPVPTKRRRLRSPQRADIPSPGEVGSRHRSTPRQGLSRLQRLQDEAWDPPILIIKGPPNNLKCWRNRVKASNSFVPFTTCSSVWKWIGDGYPESRMLIAFDSDYQRTRFLQTTKLPKHTTYDYGYLNSL